MNIFNQGDQISIPDIRHLLESGITEIPVFVNGTKILTELDISDRQRKELSAGGTLNFVRQNHG